MPHCTRARGFISLGLILALIVIAAVVGGGAYYAAQQPGQTASSTPSAGQGQPLSVAGMQQYTDTDFGFSFWYPAGWTVVERQPTKAGTSYFPGGDVTKSYNLMDTTDTFVMSVSTVYSAQSTITLNGHLSWIKYYVDSVRGEWMTAAGPLDQGTSSAVLHPADTSVHSMGGLHIFWTGQTFTPIVIPISTTKFLVFGFSGGDAVDIARSYTAPLAKTIVATDPAAGTPVSAAEQIKTIEAEKAAYSN